MKKSALFLLAFAFVIQSLSGQVLLFKQSFEESVSDNWNFTTNPAAYNSGGDVWDRVSDGGSYFNPAPDGSYFWEFYDIDTIPGLPGDAVAHLIFDTVDISGTGACSLSFYYCNRGLDSTDYMAYSVALDNSDNWDEANETILPKNSGDPAEWIKVVIDIPADAQYCRLRLSAKANYSADCGGFDNIQLTAGETILPEISIDTPADNTFYENTSTNTAISGSATNIVGMIVWSNEITDISGEIVATSEWSVASIMLAEGVNTISVTATNENGLIAADTITLNRGINFPASELGTIAFVGYNSYIDSFAFTTLRDLAAGTVIRFTDEEWMGVDFASETSEDDLVWSNNSQTPAGTVVVIYNCDSYTTVSNNIGIVSGKITLSQDADGIIAYYGDAVREPTAFLAAISTASESLIGTGLEYGQTAVGIANTPTSLYYSGARGGQDDWSDYLPLINNPANWSGTDGVTESWGDETAFTRRKGGTIILIQ